MAPKFMIHDRWENALFLHWKFATDSDLGRLFADSCPFTLDALEETSADAADAGQPSQASEQSSPTKNTKNNYWLGLVLLTERNVGPANLLPGLRKVMTFTHLGANIRTYAEGDGIFFYSLECDYSSLATAANVFGIPYKPAIMRRVVPRSIWEVNGGGGGNGRIVAGGNEGSSSADGNANSDSDASTWSDKFHFQSRRSDLTTVALSGCGGNQVCSGGAATSSSNTNNTSTDAVNTSAGYTINATWKFRHEEEDTKTESADQSTAAADHQLWLRRANFFVERYRVYTKKAGVNFRGNVAHAAWPLHRVEVEKLEITSGDGNAGGNANVGAIGGTSTTSNTNSSGSASNSSNTKTSAAYPYYSGAENSKNGKPVAINRLIADISSRPPDHVCFSPGVGPVEFDWLRPKMFW